MKLAINKQALFNYEVLDAWEAGIVLTGPEVKSVKYKQVDFKGSYISIKNDNLWLVGVHIAPYKPAKAVQQDYNPKRERQLLLHKKELNKIKGKLTQKGLTVVPLQLYTVRSLIKIQIAVVKGRKKVDKKDIIKKRDQDRDIKRTLKEN